MIRCYDVDSCLKGLSFYPRASDTPETSFRLSVTVSNLQESIPEKSGRIIESIERINYPLTLNEMA
jgi:hypothetical protein